MKSDIFKYAILNRKRIKFLYGFSEIELEPYYIKIEKNGKKVICGKLSTANKLLKFEYSKILNIKVLEKNRFSPMLPLFYN